MRSAPDPLTVFEDTVAPATSTSVTALVEANGVLNAPEALTVPIGDVSATPSSSTKRPKNVGLAAPNLLIEISSPLSLVSETIKALLKFDALATIELLYYISKSNYNGPIYFDTFPDTTNMDPVKECELNIETVKKQFKVVEKLLLNNELATAIENQDSITSHKIFNSILYP